MPRGKIKNMARIVKRSIRGHFVSLLRFIELFSSLGSARERGKLD